MRKEKRSICCVVLAAGNGVRFGGDKLSAVLEGRTLLERALDAVPAGEFDSVAVVTRSGEMADIQCLVKRHGFTLLVNPRPEQGISGSLRIGLRAFVEPNSVAVTKSASEPCPAVGNNSIIDRTSSCRCDAVLFQTADQPLLRQETVRGLVSLWRANPGKIAALAHDGIRGNPCVFPARFFPELLNLSGDRGGSAVIRRHQADLILLETPPEELLDADTPEALEQIRQILEGRNHRQEQPTAGSICPS